MHILFCHGYQREQPTEALEEDCDGDLVRTLRAQIHVVVAPSLPNGDFAESVRRVRQRAASQEKLDAVVGTSRGGAVAIAAGLDAPLILRAPAWDKFGPPGVPKLPWGTVVIHGRDDVTIPFTDSLVLRDHNPGLHVIEADGGHPHSDDQKQKLLEVLENLPLVRRLPEGKLDLVGDVHGRIHALNSLLGHLGYDVDGRHPENRHLVFLGDLVNARSYHPPTPVSDSPAVVERVRHLVEIGRARCILGNHDLEVMLGRRYGGSYWFFGEEEPPDSPCRAHRVTLATEETRSRILHFLARLPLALEREDLRVVHACWHPEMIERIRKETDAVRLHNRVGAAIKNDLWTRLALQEITHDLWRRFMDEPVQRLSRQNDNPVRVVTGGPEEVWPQGVRFVPWWKNYDADAPVCIVGHYGRPATEGTPGPFDLFVGETPFTFLGPGKNVACIDYQKGLTGLRWPERELVFDNGEKVVMRQR